MIPSWIPDIFAAIMLAVAALSAARLVVARPWQEGTQVALADTDVSHLLMAIAMAGMLTASLQTLPNGVWAVIFAVLTAWFAYRVSRDVKVSGVRALAGGHCAPHLIHAAAMLYMFLAFTAPATHASGGMGGMASGMGSLRLPFLAFAFALLLIGYSIWDVDQLSGPGASGHYSLVRTAPARSVLVGATAGPGAAAMSALASGPAALAVATEAHPANTNGSACDPASRSGRGILAAKVASSCRIAMGVTMAFMLLIMI
jgi:Domain of unknown function (DUF5134)